MKIQNLLIFGMAAALAACSAGLSGTSTGATSSRTLTADSSPTGQTVTTYAFNTTERQCAELTLETSSCQSARQALGLSGNWLEFSCNVAEGLATSGLEATTTYSDATYVTLTTRDMPDYLSNYYPTTGSYDFTAYNDTVTGLFDSLYTLYDTAFPDPNSVSQQDVVMYIPLNPTEATAKSQEMSMGEVGMAINGVVIYDSVAGATDNIFAEDGSFDQCGGHPDGSDTYHYHGDPFAISYEDSDLIGVMRDGFFVYGEYDSPSHTNAPGSIANVELAGTSSDIYVYGGVAGTTDPVTGNTTASTFRYFLSEWDGCYDEPAHNKASDDGETNDTVNSPSPSCAGEWVDTWFLTGHGNGGVFEYGGTGTNCGTGSSNCAGHGVSGWANQAPSQSTSAIRYYYGTPGSCSGCN